MDPVNVVNIHTGHIFCGCSLKVGEENSLLA